MLDQYLKGYRAKHGKLLQYIKCPTSYHIGDFCGSYSAEWQQYPVSGPLRPTAWRQGPHPRQRGLLLCLFAGQVLTVLRDLSRGVSY